MNSSRRLPKSKLILKQTIAVIWGAGLVGGQFVDALLHRGYRVVCRDQFTHIGKFWRLVVANG